MEIKINVDDLHRLLTEAGVESNDAKAIIYDLILLYGAGGKVPSNMGPGKASPRPKEVHSTPVHAPPESVSRTVLDRRKTLKTPDTGEQFEEDNSQSEEQARARVRTHKRLDFSGFGGESQGLRED